jgi:hypothetical protein
MGTIRILDETGDRVVAWMADDPQSTRSAEQVFDQQRRSALAFARPVGEPASAARPITAFDPTAEEIIFTRPVVGG